MLELIRNARWQRIVGIMLLVLGSEMRSMAQTAVNNAIAHSNPKLSAPNQPAPYLPGAQPPPEELVSGKDYAKDRLLIKTKARTLVSKAGAGARLTSSDRLNAVLAAQGVLEVSPMLKSETAAIAPMSATASRTGQAEWHRAKLRPDSKVLEVARLLSKDMEIESVEPDYMFHLTGASEENRSPASLKSPSSLPAPAGDPLLAQQWHLDAMHVREAWAHLQSLGLPPGGSHNVIVAVIDSGVDYNHADLAANIWTNSKETAGNGIDDDGNGIADDVHGVNFVGSHAGDPMDDNGHGTHVAGIIAAQAGNGAGGAGIAFNAQILPIKAADSTGMLLASDVAEAIQYAAAQHADVINMSFASAAKPLVVEDALAGALSTAVLVAAAGNQSWPTIPYRDVVNQKFGTNYYPAAYNWVLGVMASDQEGKKAVFSNWDYAAYDEQEYEVMAPGVGIWSCLPNNQYAAWSGTSMSAPMVSAIAALLRTKYPDKSQYSSRFLMGQIACTGAPGGENEPAKNWIRADAFRALTQSAVPRLTMSRYLVFDSPQVSSLNDQDGNIDSGETVDLAITIRNHWGNANQITAKLEAKGGLGQSNPYVTMVMDTVEYGGLGTFATADNGVIRDASGAITGLRSPFRFTVSPDCPNTYPLNLQLTMTCQYGADLASQQTLTFVTNFYPVVQRGAELPKTIAQDTALTKERFWIVPDQTLVPAGVTLRIGPGTRVQFGGRLATGAYQNNANPMIQVEGNLIVEGTAEEPVEMFGFDDNQYVKISAAVNGAYNLRYARVNNPALENGALADHCYFSDTIPGFSKWVTGAFKNTSNCQFRQFHESGWTSDSYSMNLFDNCIRMRFNNRMRNGAGNVLLNHNPEYNYWFPALLGDSIDARLGTIIFPTNTVINGENKTYCILEGKQMTFDIAEKIAQQFGGHLADINSAEEIQFLYSYRKTVFSADNFTAAYPKYYDGSGNISWYWFQTDHDFSWIIGLTPQGQWTSGAPITYRYPGFWDASGKFLNSGSYTVMREDSKSLYWTITSGGIELPCLLELPGKWTQEQLDARRTDAIVSVTGVKDHFRHNAILNKWLKNDVNQWTYVRADEPYYATYIAENFWSTTARSLIDALITDFKDDYGYSQMIYEPILTAAPADCYPFVADIRFATASSAEAAVVGAEPVTFHVYFNRDMNTGVQPQVSFGPAKPFTDYAVSGTWESPREWKGTKTITPITGDGWQYMRVAGAVAADDPWLVTGEDSERHRFQVQTLGTASMNLNARGGEGRVSLSWSQDDYPLLAGYNLYRSTNPTNNYARVNKTVIPPSQKTYDDASVSSGQKYYYRFTVAMTDMSESGFSNTADGTPADTVAPWISHQTPNDSLPAGLPLTIQADVGDNVSVRDVYFYYRRSGAAFYEKRSMILTKAPSYAISLEAETIMPPGLDYYIEASDGANIGRLGSAESPRKIAVLEIPVISGLSPLTGPASGGTTVRLSGVNFKPGAAVVFGGVAGTSVQWVNNQLLTCVTPAASPGAADVQVRNSDGLSGTLPRGFTYEADSTILSLPSMTAAPGDVVDIPMSLHRVRGLTSARLTVAFDSTVVQVRSARPGALAAGWSLTADTSQPGRASLVLASPGGAVSGDGVLAILEAQAVGAGQASSALALGSISLNGGAIASQSADGRLELAATYWVGGVVRYWNGGAGVGEVQMRLQGNRACTSVSDGSGSYKVSGAPSGEYALTASKTGQAFGITAYDASLVLRHAAGLASLTGMAAVAADVDRNGRIDSMDAFYILQKSVGSIELPFPKAGVIWLFNPSNVAIPDIASLGYRGNRDFVAVLLGDASGNWNASGNISGLSASSGGEPAGTNRISAAPLSLGAASKTGSACPVVLAVHRRAGASNARVMYRAGGRPVYSIEFRLSGSIRSVSALPQCMAAASRGIDGLHCGIAAAAPLNGSGELMQLELPEGSGEEVAILDAVADEGAVPVQILNGNSAQDRDGDGQDDWSECMAGTDPADAQSLLRAVRVESLHPQSGCRVVWASAAGRTYQLETRNDMGIGAWQPVGEPVTADSAEASAVDAASSGAMRLYRIRLLE